MDPLLKIVPKDKEKLNDLLIEIGDIIARSNDQGLELDFDHWAEAIFGPVTGYGRDDDPIPPAFLDAFSEGADGSSL